MQHTNHLKMRWNFEKKKVSNLLCHYCMSIFYVCVPILQICHFIVMSAFDKEIWDAISSCPLVSSDRLNVRFGRTVRPNYYCAVRPKWQNFFLQNTDFFHGNLSYFCFAEWLTCTQRYHWCLCKIAKKMPTEPKLE